MNSPPPLELIGLTTRYDDVTAVDSVDLEVRPDELLALVGPSGCGKSSILRTVAGLVAADSGTVRLAGEVVEDGKVRLPPERRSIGLVFQEHALFPHLTVRANVGFGIRSGGRAATAARVDEMLALVSLGEHSDRFPHELSGGERQRVALARALAPSPALMLFDEPFASLDHGLRVQLRVEVAEALKATSTPAVFVTHDQQEALAIGDRIAVMRGGRIVQLDTPEAVFHTPASRFVGSFMGDASFLPIEATSSGPTTLLGPIEVAEPPSYPDAVAMVRPHDLIFSADSNGPAEITSVEYHGSYFLSTVRLSDGTSVLVAADHTTFPRVGNRGSVTLAAGHEQVVTRRNS